MFIIVNDGGAVMGYASTRKKALAKAKRAMKRGSRFAQVMDGSTVIRVYDNRGQV